MRPSPLPGKAVAARRALRPSGVHWLRAGPAGPAASPMIELRYPRGSAVLIGGIPGAGKTTLLRRAAGASAGSPRVLDPDAWRVRLARRLPGFLPYRAYRPVVHLLHYAAVACALAGGQELLVHESATRALPRRWFVRRARRAGRSAHLVLLDVDLPAAREGQAARGRMLRRGQLRRHWARWRALRAELLDPAPPDSALGREGWWSSVVLDREAAGRVAAFRFGPDASGPSDDASP